MSLNFSWVVENKLAGSARPGKFGKTDIYKDLDLLFEAGIRAILSVMVEDLPEAETDGRFQYLHLPVYGFTPPTPEQMIQALEFIEANNAENRPVLVHCAEGVGRTGTVLACYFVAQGYQPTEAIRFLRKLRPNSVEHSSQMDAIYTFAQRKNSL
jgi:atypical dual specificity phosphatase